MKMKKKYRYYSVLYGTNAAMNITSAETLDQALDIAREVTKEHEGISAVVKRGKRPIMAFYRGRKIPIEKAPSSMVEK
jgi:hypothetical protein